MVWELLRDREGHWPQAVTPKTVVGTPGLQASTQAALVLQEEGQQLSLGASHALTDTNRHTEGFWFLLRFQGFLGVVSFALSAAGLTQEGRARIVDSNFRGVAPRMYWKGSFHCVTCGLRVPLTVIPRAQPPLLLGDSRWYGGGCMNSS